MSPSPISVPPPEPGAASTGSGDACPGALRLHMADDGFLARVRVPGGVLGVDQARALAGAAGRLGDGMLHLTSRGNVQLRGLRDGCGAELAGVLGAAGLLPSAAHERVRNVVASPMSGLDGCGFVDVREWLTGLDAGLCASSVTPELSGRFLFGLDDGRGDVAALRPDVLVRGLPSGEAEVFLGEVGVRVPYGRAAEVAVAAAEVFVAAAREASGRVWRVAELGLPAEELERLLSAHPALTPRGSAPDPAAQSPQGLDFAEPALTPRGSAPDPAAQSPQGLNSAATALGNLPPWAAGWARRPPVPRNKDVGPGPGARPVVTVPLGAIGPRQWDALTELAGQLPPRELRLTPWRSVVVPGATPEQIERLAETGLVSDPTSPWTRVAACIGRPGCAKSHADVRHDATVHLDEAHPTLPTYWSGCERRCGHPAEPYVDIVAQPDGSHTTTVPSVPHHTES
ncbi:cobalamin biosynthesis protein CobG [Streptomyces sp. NBC_00006]|uniref:cobalamin biosynthesis protein CobG n=1 Tax=Streptomyces sp. NBC_00006 TaxID=2975619 RepID=UPI00224FE268|nr:cobalamin biosynthesis protein CobG [Streptomyces sp. NBC_00006]MCX5532646.1 cobalamin biosynthesis protein CobG [Streptomyces sp. NBC_00006]